MSGTLVRVIGGISTILACAYFGFLLAITSKTYEPIGAFVGVVLASGLIMQIATVPYI